MKERLVERALSTADPSTEPPPKPPIPRPIPDVEKELSLTDCVGRLIELDEKKKRLDAESKDAAGTIAEIKTTILALMEQSGVQRLTMRGKTAYLHRQLWAKAKESERSRAIDALHAAGLSEMVYETFNTNTLSAHVRELPQDEDGMPIMPPALEAGVEISEKFDVRIVRAGK